MQEHGSNSLPSPLRGTPGWWQELGQADKPAPQPRPKKRSRKKNGPAKSAQPASGIRQELVDRVRRQIADGNYDTPERWEAALDCLLDNLEAR